MGTSPMEALLSRAPCRDYTDRPCSASSPSQIRQASIPESGSGLAYCKGTTWRYDISQVKGTLQIRFPNRTKRTHLGRKTAVHDANADLVKELRVPSDADDNAIQDALRKLFNAQVQEQIRAQSETVSDAVEGSGLAGHKRSVRISTGPQGTELRISTGSRHQSEIRSSSVQIQFRVRVQVQAFKSQVQISSIQVYLVSGSKQ